MSFLLDQVHLRTQQPVLHSAGNMDAWVWCVGYCRGSVLCVCVVMVHPFPSHLQLLGGEG